MVKLKCSKDARGRVFHAEGGPAPISVAMTEWDSADVAIAFFQSKVWKDLAPKGEPQKRYADAS
jgi:hypothetical protein